MIENKTVIIVDDDHDLRRTLCDFLDSIGYSVQQAADGNNALKLVEEEHPDLVIIDIFMPDKEGISTIMELKNDFPNVKVIAISGGGQIGSSKVLDTAEKLGADAVLGKPFSMDELEVTMEDLFPETFARKSAST